MTSTIARGKAPADSYLTLVRRFPLRALHSERDYDRAAEALRELFGRDDLDAGERDYVEALSVLVEAYDRRHFDMGPDKRSPLERLNHLIEQSGTTSTELGKILGSRSAASMILLGRRALSRGHVQKLAKHFKIEPGYFV